MRIGACLSLSGRFARFGRQAAEGLTAWRRITGHDVEIEDDRSDPEQLKRTLPGIAARADLVLGPYSTLLARAAAETQLDKPIWNHGGAGDDVQALGMISVLAPTSRYALPFLRARTQHAPLWVAHGPGSFGRQVASGALRAGAVVASHFDDVPETWDLLTAGTFEDDVALVAQARAAPTPPRAICSIAAGVRAFADAIGDPDGIYGIAQWLPGVNDRPRLGPTERAFVDAYGGTPDYPAVQAAAAATIATHCAILAGGLDRDALTQAAASLETTTLLGRFKIDQASGAQTGLMPVLLQWIGGARLSPPAGRRSCGP